MPSRITYSLGIAIAFACPMVAQTSAAERFDLSGMPSKPSSFVEQSIQELVHVHRRGDLQNAAWIQHKLARYYAEKGDKARATAAEACAALAEQGGSTLSNDGNTITLHITGQTGASVSASADGGSLLTGGTQCKDETRRQSFQIRGSEGDGGIWLDGVNLKFRNR